MAWFTNGTKIDTRLNSLRDKIHSLEDRIVYLEDRIHKFSNAIYLLQEDIKQSKTTDKVHNPKDSEVLSDKFVESARKTYPITPSLYDESNIVTDANLISTVVINPYITDTDATCQSTSATISTRDSSNSSSCISSSSTDYSPPSSSSYDSGSSYSSSSDSGGSYD